MLFAKLLLLLFAKLLLLLVLLLLLLQHGQNLLLLMQRRLQLLHLLRYGHHNTFMSVALLFDFLRILSKFSRASLLQLLLNGLQLHNSSRCRVHRCHNVDGSAVARGTPPQFFFDTFLLALTRADS